MTQPNKPAALDAVAWLYEDDDFQHVQLDRAIHQAFPLCAETPLTDLTKAQERIDRLEAVVRKCRDQFDFYVASHLGKQPPDMDKAATNQEFVEFCDTVLGDEQ